MSPNQPDLIIRHGDVIDGTGQPRFRVDVAITGDRITAIGDLSQRSAKQEIDATGRIVSPGFIDVHTHDDRLLLSHPVMTPKLSQGVTTVVTGNCGISLAPLVVPDRPPPPLDLLGDSTWYRFPTFADYVAALETNPPAINTAPLVGHSTLRVAVMENVGRPATLMKLRRCDRGFRKPSMLGPSAFPPACSIPPTNLPPGKK
jgi:N-acyl-D-amino-acid deacylase